MYQHINGLTSLITTELTFNNSIAYDIYAVISDIILKYTKKIEIMVSDRY